MRRVDVAQADVAALMTYLVGTNFPVNSVGELPLEYVDADDSEKAKAIFANAKQILEQYTVKEGKNYIQSISILSAFLSLLAQRLIYIDRKRATKLRFKPYPLLGEGILSPELRTAVIEDLINDGSYRAAISESLELITLPPNVG